MRHKCDNPPCVNPDHLEVGSQADNVRDAVVRKRHRAIPRSGQSNPNAKLTNAQVAEIRARLAAGETGRALAVEFGVTAASISRYKLGRAY